MKKYKTLFKQAKQIQAVLSNIKKDRSKEILSRLESIFSLNSTTIKNSRLLCIALRKNWPYAANRMLDKVQRDMYELGRHLSQFRDLGGREDYSAVTLSDIIAELLQIEQEFETFNLSEKTLSVTTRPITLEGIPLGPFKIELLLDELSELRPSNRPYLVIALDPNPASTDDAVTHPHVSDETLCEGQAEPAITTALEQRRLCDFFMLVNGVLRTYNSSGAHVKLSEWGGSSCYDCGCTVSSDESYYCRHCRQEYCDGCSTYCQICNTTVCLGCAFNCSTCNKPVCSSCRAACKDCEKTFCKDCLSDGLCQGCEEQRKEDEYDEYDENDESNDEETESLPSIQPDSVG